MELEIISTAAPSRPSPQQQMPSTQQQTTPLQQQMPPTQREIVRNAGQVKLPNGLGFDPDWVDCPTCRMRRKTKIIKVPSEHTRYEPRILNH